MFFFVILPLHNILHLFLVFLIVDIEQVNVSWVSLSLLFLSPWSHCLHSPNTETGQVVFYANQYTGFYIRQTLVVQRTRSNFNSKQYLIVNVFLLLVSYKHFVSKVSMIYLTNVRQNRVTSDESCFTTVTFVGREANISYLCLKPQKHSLSIGLSCPGFSFYEHLIDNLLVRFLLYSNP